MTRSSVNRVSKAWPVSRIMPLTWENPVSEGDLNTETGAISPDRGNHTIKVTGAGRMHLDIPRRVRCLARHLAYGWPGGKC